MGLVRRSRVRAVVARQRRANGVHRHPQRDGIRRPTGAGQLTLVTGGNVDGGLRWVGNPRIRRRVVVSGDGDPVVAVAFAQIEAAPVALADDHERRCPHLDASRHSEGIGLLAEPGPSLIEGELLVLERLRQFGPRGQGSSPSGGAISLRVLAATRGTPVVQREVGRSRMAGAEAFDGCIDVAELRPGNDRRSPRRTDGFSRRTPLLLPPFRSRAREASTSCSDGGT